MGHTGFSERLWNRKGSKGRTQHKNLSSLRESKKKEEEKKDMKTKARARVENLPLKGPHLPLLEAVAIRNKRKRKRKCTQSDGSFPWTSRVCMSVTGPTRKVRPL